MRFTVAPLVLFAAACIDTTLTPDIDKPTEIRDGAIKGRVCDPSGRTWLADAQISANVLEDGVIVDTRIAYSDVDGRWTIDELPGERTYTVHVQHGPDEIAEPEPVFVPSGVTVELDEPECFDPLEVDVAVVTGDYDDFVSVLNDMGFSNYYEVDGLDESAVGTFLDDPAELAKYDIIFFNGGFVEEGVIYDTAEPGNAVPLARMQNIRDYVAAGGSIYASDWAYDVVEIGWPDRADFAGDDALPDDAQLGDYVHLAAPISDASLAEHLGTDYLDVTFDLQVWPPVVNVVDSVSVHVSGSVPYSDGLNDYVLTSSPLLYSFNAGSGKVVFSSFRVASNANDDVVSTLQYMMYRL